jgi:hypothetical protein
MPKVGFEPTIPVFEREETVHALDRAVTVIDPLNKLQKQIDGLSDCHLCTKVHAP